MEFPVRVCVSDTANAPYTSACPNNAAFLEIYRVVRDTQLNAIFMNKNRDHMVTQR